MTDILIKVLAFLLRVAFIIGLAGLVAMLIKFTANCIKGKTAGTPWWVWWAGLH